jgi:hypothetical protein
MAKSQTGMIYVRQGRENLVYERAGPHERDFAISITFGDAGGRAS